MIKVYRTKEVFIAGGTPTATYNPRQASRLERDLERFLETTGKALTVYGPSKSGKTSLVGRLLPATENVWLQGQDIRSLDDLWTQLAARLEIPNALSIGSSSETTREDKAGLSLGVPKVISGDLSQADSQKSGERRDATKQVHLADHVRSKLAETHRPVIIDDFHYIPDSIKRQLARAIKSIILASPIVLIAVPSEAFEVVSSEPDLSMRLWSIEIPPWEESELAEIAARGFALLNLRDVDGTVANKLARLSYQSPYIMQQLCLDLVRWEMGVKETVPEDAPRAVELPDDLDAFLRGSAQRSPFGILPKMLAGPPYSNRAQLRLKADRTTTDIYGAVMVALKNLIPPLSHTEHEVYQEVNRILTSNVQTVQVTNALDGMHKIAERERGESDPVLRRRDGKVFIEDSGFAFYLNHGAWTPEKTFPKP